MANVLQIGLHADVIGQLDSVADFQHLLVVHPRLQWIGVTNRMGVAAAMLRVGKADRSHVLRPAGREALPSQSGVKGPRNRLAQVQAITACRMELACRLLGTEPDRSVTDIAYACGFHSSQYFATLFRRNMRVPPKQWRQSVRQAN